MHRECGCTRNSVCDGCQRMRVEKPFFLDVILSGGESRREGPYVGGCIDAVDGNALSCIPRHGSYRLHPWLTRS